MGGPGRVARVWNLETGTAEMTLPPYPGDISALAFSSDGKTLATVLTNVSDDSKMLNDEIFGPVASLQSFKSEDEVITRANDTEYGLVAYLFTKDLSRGMRVSEKLDFGMIGLNRGLVSDPAAPFGGVKQSGLGREGAHEGLMEFMETQYISVTW